jgi:hypothetical protein
MKNPLPSRRIHRGYVAYVLVISTSVLMALMMIYAYRDSMAAQAVQGEVQMHVDYYEKEETILRSIVSITPNRAIQAMQHGSDLDESSRAPLSWQSIFRESIFLANAHTSVDAALLEAIKTESHKVVANAGDSKLTDTARIFNAVGGESGWVSSGTGRSLGLGFPAPLNIDDIKDAQRDVLHPVISNSKRYGHLATGAVGAPVEQYPQFNLLRYPEINFGYARPGEPFVAKHNWWAFELDLAGHDNQLTGMARKKREMILSIYEIPSQLAISAAAFVNFGEHASGQRWQNVNIEGNVFAGRAQVSPEMQLSGVASRRQVELGGDSTIGGRTFETDPFAPGVREAHLLINGDFFPVSMPSESGRAAFIPINRGAEFFDRFSHTAEANTISSTTWNNYSIGALQCAMQLDIAEAAGPDNTTPTMLRFSYLKQGIRESIDLPLDQAATDGLPPGYLFACAENQTYDFGEAVVDLAFGANGSYSMQTAMTGQVTFDVARFGDPAPSASKAGYFRPAYPFEIRQLAEERFVVVVYPRRFPAFLHTIGADDVAENHSLVVNVDYVNGLNLAKPSIPTTDLDYAVVLEECDDLTDFTRGFSLVTNLRLHINDDFNTVAATPPTGYEPEDDFYPPCSLFAPEQRYGLIHDPSSVRFVGRVGSLSAEDSDAPIRPLDSVGASGQVIDGGRIEVNLRPIRHPAELPPVTMMNWLILLQERRGEFFTEN